MKKRYLISVAIIIAVVCLVVFLLNDRKQQTPEEITKCIGQNSVLYVQLGCHACGIQEEMFGESGKYLTKVDCFYQRDECSEIQKTPTWVIKGQKYEGVQTIETLQGLTNCK